MWDVSLDDAAVTAIYNSGTPIALDADDGNYDNSGDLQGWWRMGDGTLDDGNITGNGLIADQTSATLGSELFDSDAKAFAVGGSYNGSNPSEHATDTYGWIQQGANGLENDSGELKITYADSANGAQFYFRDASDLSAEMDANSVYKFTFQARYAEGSSGVKAKIYDTVGYVYSDAFTTSMATYTIYFHTYSAPASTFFRLETMASSNIVYIDNLSLKKVNGNPGTMINMTASDIVEAVPS